MLEGQIGARVGDQELTAGPGCYVLKPRRVPHTFWNPGPGPARVLEIISPAGFERYFEQAPTVTSQQEGLVELDPPAAGVPVLALVAGDEVGAELLLLGRGELGNGRHGVLGADHRLRCVTNRVDSVDDHWLRLRFDPPPGGTALEGVGGGGDSGGPALIRADGSLQVAGVASWQDHGGRLGTYGCVEHYARVCTQVAWIRAVCGR